MNKFLPYNIYEMKFVVTLQKDVQEIGKDRRTYLIVQRYFNVESNLELLRNIAERVDEESDTVTIVDILNITQVF